MRRDYERGKLLTEPAGGDHMVQFYAAPADLVASINLYVDAALKKHRAVILITRQAHWEGVRAALNYQGHNVVALESSRQLMHLDAEETLNQLMVNGMPDRERCLNVIGTYLEKAYIRFGTVCAYGEMVDILWQRGKAAEAVHLEELWNNLSRSYSFHLLCGYKLDIWDSSLYQGRLQAICSKHSHCILGEDHRHWNSAVERALHEILEPGVALTLDESLERQRSLTQMPLGVAKLLRLGMHSPALGAEVMSRASVYYYHRDN